MKNLKSELAREYVKRFPTTSSLSLARKMYSENLEYFKNVEDARRVIRYARGLDGSFARKNMAHKELIVKPNSLNPYKIPKTFSTKLKVLTLPKHHNNILLISDLHIPYHDIDAITLAINYGKEKGINTIFINGDLLDFFMISRFRKVRKAPSVKTELDMARTFLDILNREFPNVPIYFLLGNHDQRLEHYLADKAPELLDVEEFQLKDLLKAKLHNMVVIEDTTLVKMGSLAVTHGHLLIRGVFAPVNAARGAFLKAKASVLVSHVHKISTHSETNINNKLIVTYSTGCLCELNPAYNPFGNNYSLGFAHISVQSNGNYQVRNLQILDGKILL